MTEPLVHQDDDDVREHHHNHHHQGCVGAVVGGKSAGHVLVSADLSSSSLSAVDFCASDIDWDTSPHTTRY